tara:strand:+ start:9779 stop:10333 length:555 start_codon:yes stop_codon:yes gene_type:complete
MIKIAINYEYEIPEKEDSYKKTKLEVINSLMKEKEEMKSYLMSKQEEINDAIEVLIKGTNITEAENFIREVSRTIKEESFEYIGEKRQKRINDIYLTYREVIKGVKAFIMLNENNVFEGEEEKLLLVKAELQNDIHELNKLLEKENTNLKIDLDNILTDKDYYEIEICEILEDLKKKRGFSIVR